MDTNPIDESPVTLEPVANRQSLWRRIGGFSLTTAIVVHVMLLIAGAFWVFHIEVAVKDVDFGPGKRGGGNDGPPSVHQTMVKKTQVHPSSDVRRIAAVGVPAPITISTEGNLFAQMSQLPSIAGGIAGDGSGVGPGSGGRGTGNGPLFGPDGNGRGPLFLPLPEVMAKRCSPSDRQQRIRDNGGTPACEDSVIAALRWLKANQAPDGSWGDTNKVAMTGFALLGYFGHCENPASPEFGESCMRGIVYLVGVGLRNDGKLATNFTANHWPYEHAIAAYALGEAATFCKDMKLEVPSLMEVTGKAGQFIIDNQHENGGWAYLYAKTGGHTDVSVTGWQIQALKACSHTGINFKGLNNCINHGLGYLSTCQNENGGYGYTGKTPAGGLSYMSLSGVGMLCHQMWGKGGGSSIRKAGKYVLANTRLDYNGENCDLYAHYYESQAMMQSDKESWKTYNNLFRDQILQNQDADGSWKVPGGGRKIAAVGPEWAASTREGKIYRTCLCTLMLEVYYRFLNTDQGNGRGRTGV